MVIHIATIATHGRERSRARAIPMCARRPPVVAVEARTFGSG